MRGFYTMLEGNNYFALVSVLVVVFLVDFIAFLSPLESILVSVFLVVFLVSIFFASCAKATEPITNRATTDVMIFFILCDFVAKLSTIYIKCKGRDDNFQPWP